MKQPTVKGFREYCGHQGAGYGAIIVFTKDGSVIRRERFPKGNHYVWESTLVGHYDELFRQYCYWLERFGGNRQ